MTFFNKKQDVIDIKLTQFGKNLLARGHFKPVFYMFFDDGIMYNSESGELDEKQKRIKERIEEAQRPRTQHLVTGVEARYDFNENLISEGNVDRLMEIKRRQDPMLADKILKYPLGNSQVNNQNTPIFNINVMDSVLANTENNVQMKGVTYNIPQLTITSSYELVEDRTRQIDIPDDVLEFQSYMDLLSNKVEFLDKSRLEVKEEEIIIDIEELNVDAFRENFEIEIYEVNEKGELLKIENEEEVKKLFEIKVDEEVEQQSPSDVRSDRFRREEE